MAANPATFPGRRTLTELVQETVVLCVLPYREKNVADKATILLSALSPEEKARCLSMRSAVRRHEFILGRALARLILSTVFCVPLPVAPLSISARGRPYVAGHNPIALDVNLSHSQSHLLVGATCLGQLGVDIQGTLPDWETMAKRFLNAEEFERLVALPEEMRSATMTRAWAIKEAWSKALGLGLAVSLRRLNTGLQSEGRLGDVSWCALDELGRLSAATAVASRMGESKARINHAFIRTTVDHLAEFVASKTLR
ncbi:MULTISPECIES: 4'-phosphopantetheinyl transferase family protein [unclassified Bradyrhizobium]|uniref:4'-phosphopantetheinyl transferase family protein n=1 Tax=unclassified Bradyrhizobium TaxID=2631580 RepID=UPI0028E93A39|nr:MULTISPECIES: 4'-phosphopantetheinyl transferase superfamily protein [unclassified Bradyrhizobium]